MSRQKKINGHNAIAEAVEKSLNEYFHHLDGEAPDDIYRMVIENVEKSLLANVMQRAEGNQTQAADMLGINRTTLRTKLKAHRLA
jgi:Fis family transcriptional regulator